MSGRDTDRGYAWVILAAAFMGYYIQGCVTCSLTLVYQPLLHRFQMNAANTGSVGAVYTASLLFPAIFVAMVLRHVTYRCVTMAAGLIYSAGFLLTAFSTSPIMVFVGLGGMGGLAAGMFMMSGYSIIPQYFVKRRSLAFGIAMSAFGIASFTFPPLFELCLKNYGFTASMTLMAGITLHFVVVGALLKPHSEPCMKQIATKTVKHAKVANITSTDVNVEESICNKKEINSTGNKNEAVNSAQDSIDNMSQSMKKSVPFNIIQYLGLHLLINPLYCAFIGVLCSLTLANFGGQVYISGLAKERCGLDDYEISIALSIGGIADIFLRPAIGLIMDNSPLRHHCTQVYMILVLVYGVSSFGLAYLVWNLASLVVWWILYIDCVGVTVSLGTVVLAEMINIEDLSTAIGLNRFFQGIVIFPGIRSAGTLVDYTGSYVTAFLYIGIISCTSLVIFEVTLLCQGVCKKHKNIPLTSV